MPPGKEPSSPTVQPRVVSEIPKRLRVELRVPGGWEIDVCEVERALAHSGTATTFAISRHTGRILLRYDGAAAERNALLAALSQMPLSIAARRRAPRNELGRRKRAVVRSVASLVLSPLLAPGARTAVTICGAFPILRKGLTALSRRSLNVDVLDASAICAAVGLRELRTASLITLLLKVGDYLSEWTKEKSRKSLGRMFFSESSHAWVRRNGKELAVAPEDLAVGDMVVVRAGFRIPVDGVVAEGDAMVNQSSLTGEALPVVKCVGMLVYAGTMVESGRLAVRAVKVGEDRRVARIIRVIEESEGARAEVQSHAERLADRIVPFSFIVSGLAYVLTGNLTKAASVLLVDYSCAIKLSTPLAIKAGMIQAAKHGVLIKGGRFLEKLSRADVFVIDKTGTLTEASPRVLDVVPFCGWNRERLLRDTACIEEHFPHPVANAVVRLAKEEGIAHEEEHGEVDYVVAHGIVSRIKGQRIMVGSRHFISEDEGIDTTVADPIIEQSARHGHSAIYVAMEDRLVGVILVEDPLRNSSREFLTGLKAAGISRIIMLTGDCAEAATSVAERLGIGEFLAEVLPDAKTAIIRRLRDEGHVIAMIGDGANDSPALAVADVGISLKEGAEIAREACDILLLNGNLLAILDAHRVSRQAIALVRRNFRYIFGINSLLILLGLAGAFPPAISAVAHNGTTLVFALNSIRALLKGVGGNE
ncbi:MAG: heavy metal translocating P-type ATPase [Acidobacteria bacterium]|nr:heavy metal translocating P-type ATPase [Acidobacteriota bacterium]